MSNEFVFHITPIPKPRMVKSDTWKKRPVVLNYWRFKDDINLMAKMRGFVMPDEGTAIAFIMPMPKSWSKKKQNEMNGQPHKQTPDLDNLIKATWDCLADQDKHLWKLTAIKRWGKDGMIIIQNI